MYILLGMYNILILKIFFGFNGVHFLMVFVQLQVCGGQPLPEEEAFNKATESVSDFLIYSSAAAIVVIEVQLICLFMCGVTNLSWMFYSLVCAK